MRRRRRGEAEIVGAKWSRRLRLMRARQNMRDCGEGGGGYGRRRSELEEEKENGVGVS